MDQAKTVYLSLGSNLGEREANLEAAVEALKTAGVQVVKRSSVYETEPVGFGPQAWFLNCVVEAQTSLMPRQLLRVVREIERGLGRRRMVREGPRAIDIDILLYGKSTVRAADLEIPHPGLATRRFVLVPLAEIAPTLRHPTLGATVAELLAGCRNEAAVRRYLKWQT